MQNKIVTRHEYGAGGSYLFPQFVRHIDKNHIKTIFEAGSRDLLDAIALKNHYQNSTVYAFECNPEGIKICEHNLKGESNILFSNIGLSDINGEKTFYSFDSNKTEHHNHGVSSFYKHKDENDVPSTPVTVNCKTVDSFCEENSIESVDMFCFDMQGGEYSALLGAKKIISNVKYIILENDAHSYQNAPDFKLIEEFLNQNSFVMVEQYIGDRLFVNTKYITLTEENIITGNAFKKIADDFLDEEKTFLDMAKKPKVIFLKTDWIEIFKNKILPKIDYQFTLITHNADRPAPSGNLDLLNDDRLIKWYGMNCDITHPKLQSIPIGIANEKWPHGNKKELLEVINTNTEKTNLCYSNFDLSTNVLRRPQILEIIKTKSFINIETQKLNFKDYLTKLKSYKYVISPPGNSIDCHRIWECLYLGVIPIVERHSALEFFYDLPILFVDSFEDVTEELLNNQYENIIRKSNSKIFFTFYKNLISNE